MSFSGLFFERDHWSKNLKNEIFFDYPVSKESIDKLPKDIKRSIYSEMKECSTTPPLNAKNYYEYIQALAGKTLQDMFFQKYPEKLWGISTKKLDANWAPKRIQIREKSTPFYWNQWSAVGVTGSGTIIKSLEKKILSMGGVIRKSEPINKISLSNSRIRKIDTNNRSINIGIKDVVINTTSYLVISNLLNKKTNLQYRGVVLVYLELNHTDVFPKGVDFVYIDDRQIYFNRVSDQNSFVKNPNNKKTVICCEIAYSPGDVYDSMNESDLSEEVKRQFVKLKFTDNIKNISDSKVVKLTEVYPMFFVGYQSELAKTKAEIEAINNMYTLGSLAEYAYNDIQVLFSKAIDLAELLTSKTFEVNKINKAIPRLLFNQKVKYIGFCYRKWRKNFYYC